MIECVIGSGETEDQSDRLFLLFLKKILNMNFITGHRCCFKFASV